jgi:XRE family transcriptional regulator, regulator of sulfur utilization
MDEAKDSRQEARHSGPPVIGKNIQAFRKKLQYTLDVLAEKSGVSKAMLSQIESDKVNPTIATVWKIAQGLGVEINELLKGGSVTQRKFTVTRMNTITQLNTDEEGVHIKVLSPISMVEDLEMYYVTIQPGSALRSGAHFPNTVEFLTIIKGSVRVTAGDNSSELQPGDFISYHCDVAHSIENISARGPAEVHMVVRFSKKQWN